MSADVMPTEADRARASHIVANWRVNFDHDDDRPLVNMIETYLAVERQRARAELMERFAPALAYYFEHGFALPEDGRQ